MTLPPREAVGLFPERIGFEAAVHHLLVEGFEPADLSVLDSHESLDAANRPEQTWKEVLTALVGEIKYEGPLVASGAVLLAGGPTAAAIAAIIAAATAGVVAKDVLDEVTARPHTEHFANALDAGGVILWIACDTPEKEQQALKILDNFGAANVHMHQRSR